MGFRSTNRPATQGSAAPALFVGCASWAHRPWVGRYLPARTRPGRELEAYAGWCNSVEGNTTHYALPTADTVARWRDMTPDSFRFAFKLPRTATHERRLRDVEAQVEDFLAVIAPLGQRVGPIIAQLPPSFGPESMRTLVRFIERLDGLGDVPGGWAVELRHPAFFAGGSIQRAIDHALTAAHVGRIVLDARCVHTTPPQSAAAVQERASKPLLPIVPDEHSAHPIVRVIGADDEAATWEAARVWMPAVRRWLAAGRRPYLFVHQPDNVDSIALARRFHDEVAALTDGLAALGPPPTGAPPGELPGQAALW